MYSKYLLIILGTLGFLVAGCSISTQNDSPTPTPLLIITATLPPAPTQRPSETPLPPSPTSTVAPVQGLTSTQLNVRAEPSTVSEVLGIIAAKTTVQIVGQDPGGNWWQIIYEAGKEGKGWVTAQYVETVDKPEVPAIGGEGKDPITENSAIVSQQINIRSGPGTSFDSIGILNPNDVVSLTGKNRDASWLQIEFAGGKGWINSSFVKSDMLDALPIISDTGNVVGTGTPVDTPLPPAPTIVPAPMDFDSADAPLKTILFDRVGTGTLIYNGDVSAPDGDVEDWLAFTPYDSTVFASIRCVGNGSLIVNIIGTETNLTCNRPETAINVQVGVMNLVHIEAETNSGSLQYVNYIITIKASQ